MATAPLPDPARMRGRAPGVIFAEQLPASLKLWRGKIFESAPGGGARGKNLMGAGLLVFPIFRFSIDIGESKFHEREILLINHDLRGNPRSVRRFHDELVAVSDSLCLASSHLPSGDGLRFVCHFTLKFAQVVRP